MSETPPLFEGEELDEIRVIKEVRTGESLEDHVLRRYVELSQMNYFEILDVKEGEELSKIKKAYYQLAKQYHPDRIRRVLSRELVYIAENLFGYISRAYSVLSDADTRQNYLAVELPQWKERQKLQRKRSEETVYANALCLQGEIALKEGKIDRARTLFHKAQSVLPQEPRYEMYAVWVDYLKRDHILDVHRQTVKEKIMNCFRKDSHLPKCFLLLGIILFEEGQRAAGIHEVQKYLKEFPNDPLGLRVLELGLNEADMGKPLSKLVFYAKS